MTVTLLSNWAWAEADRSGGTRLKALALPRTHAKVSLLPRFAWPHLRRRPGYKAWPAQVHPSTLKAANDTANRLQIHQAKAYTDRRYDSRVVAPLNFFFAEELGSALAVGG